MSHGFSMFDVPDFPLYFLLNRQVLSANPDDKVWPNPIPLTFRRVHSPKFHGCMIQWLFDGGILNPLLSLELTYPLPLRHFLSRWFSLLSRWDMWGFSHGEYLRGVFLVRGNPVCLWLVHPRVDCRFGEKMPSQSTQKLPNKIPCPPCKPCTPTKGKHTTKEKR